MSAPPPWPARRVGKRILCGRKVEGRFVCQGEIAPGVAPGPERTLPVLGHYLGRAPSGELQLHARAKQKLADGRNPQRPNRRGQYTIVGQWTRKCPQCGVLAVVDSTLL